QAVAGKQAILAGDIVFDCYYCEQPMQLTLPLALIAPRKAPSAHRIAKRSRQRCEAWLTSQHPGYSLSQVVQMAGWHDGRKWAFDGYNWKEGDIHHHGQDAAPTAGGGNP